MKLKMKILGTLAVGHHGKHSSVWGVCSMMEPRHDRLYLDKEEFRESWRLCLWLKSTAKLSLYRPNVFFLTVKGYRCFSGSAWIWENKWELIQVTTQEGTRRGWGWRGKRETWQRDGQWYSPVCEVGQRRCGWKKWQQPPSDKHLVWYEDWRGSREAGASIACWREEIHGLHMWRIQR